MKILFSICLFITLAASRCGSLPNGSSPAFRLLVFSKTAGFRHESIPEGIAAIRQLGQQHGFSVEATEDAAFFTQDQLAKYRVVVFLNTTLDVLNGAQQAAFERYIRSGGGFVGVHSAADTEYDWAWYGKLVGGYFESHPHIQEAVIRVKHKEHPACEGIPADWKRTDEWYNYKSLNPATTVLMTLDESTYEGGKNGTNHPIAWFHDYDGGRAFYTGLGHRKETYGEPLFLQHLWGGIRWAAGL
jgi:type 1 glutamine amidotransferase